MQAAFKIAREGAIESTAARPSVPDDWPAQIAVEMSRARRSAIWASVCEHACVGGYARAESGRLLATEMRIDGRDYQREPDRILAEFACVKGASVVASFKGPLDAPRDGLAFALVAERGSLLEHPRPLEATAARGFEPVLRAFGDSVALRIA